MADSFPFLFSSMASSAQIFTVLRTSQGTSQATASFWVMRRCFCWAGVSCSMFCSGVRTRNGEGASAMLGLRERPRRKLTSLETSVQISCIPCETTFSLGCWTIR